MARRNEPDKRIAVLFFDLDRFKNINDTLGHSVGDRLLQSLPERLQACVRKGDTVARFGGDEFAILVEGVGVMEDASHIAEKLIDVLSRPVLIDEHELFVTTSIGISIYPDDSADAHSLLKHADTAMYRAKDMGRNTYQFYSNDMSVKAFERLSMETSLRRALDRNEFELHFQPQIDLVSGKIIGAEALIRWNHPEIGTVSPVKFIPLLEDTGLIIPVGEWVLETAAREAKSWQSLSDTPVRVAVNLSSRQFYDDKLKRQVAEIISHSGLDPQLFDLEITESILMQNDQASMGNLRALHSLGVRLSVDDFGTGYSSLGYLKRFTVDTLKIDRSFIHDVTTDPDDAAIVAAIIVMAHSLKLEVVAEGVETAEQYEFLRSRSCDAMQGYLFSKPVAALDMKMLLKQGASGKILKYPMENGGR
jgi:diguanylate cyclase (GGDEF)-like protein